MFHCTPSQALSEDSDFLDCAFELKSADNYNQEKKVERERQEAERKSKMKNFRK